MDPFATAEDDDKKDEKADDANGDSNDDKASKAKAEGVPKSDTNAHRAQPPGVADTKHPSDKGAAEQAASVAPEGTKEAEVQRKGEATHGDAQIDEERP